MRYEFLVESYETERVKVVSVWSEFRDEDLSAREIERVFRREIGVVVAGEKRDARHVSREKRERLGAENVAAFFAEPVIGAGGVHPPAPGYLEGCAKVCRAFRPASCPPA